MDNNQITNHVLSLLKSLFDNQFNEAPLTYDNVDAFYAYIGYDLEAENLLHALDIHSTSDLLAKLESCQ